MNDRFQHELAPGLAEMVRSTQQDTSGAAESAQRRLMARLVRRAPRKPLVLRSWPAIAATAGLAVVLLVVGPMLTGGGNAFASVQERFRDFQWLSMTVTQRFHGQVLQRSHTLVNREGLLRTDIGDQLSVVVDPQRGRLLTLLHAERQATRVALPKTSAPGSKRLQWLDDLRAFKGKAAPLRDPRTIAGRPAQGWLIELNGQRTQIWADSDGLPLEMSQLDVTGLQVDYRFDFNPPANMRHISSDPPSGYSLTEPDEN